MCSYWPKIRAGRLRFELVEVGFEGFPAKAGVVLPQGFTEGGLLSGLLGEQPTLDGAKVPGISIMCFGHAGRMGKSCFLGREGEGETAFFLLRHKTQ